MKALGYTGDLGEFLSRYEYQPRLTQKPDDLTEIEFTQHLVNEIVLWKVDRYVSLDGELLAGLNEHEVKAMARIDSVRQAASALARNVELVVAKLGADGALMADKSGLLEIPALPVQVVDTTGAGDSFNAGFIYKYILEGGSKAEALRFANACGAIAVTRVGGASSVPGASEVEIFLTQYQ